MYQTEKNAVPNPEIFRKILIFKIPVIFEKRKLCCVRDLPIFWNWTHKNIVERQLSVVSKFEKSV